MHRIIVIVLISILMGCSPEPAEPPPSAAAPAAAPEPAAEPELSIYTVNYPLAYFAERIAGDTASVSFPAPPDVDPAYWSPDVEAISAYQSADLILLNGAGYAGWVANATLPESRLIDTTAALSDRLIAVKGALTHSHGPGGEHSHDVTAITTWLDLEIAIGQAAAVMEALVAARPESEDRFRQSFADLESDLKALDARLLAAAESFGERPILFSHPVYQYFERRYDLNGYSVHWEPGEMPGDRQWRNLESVLRQHPSTLMLWEDEPLAETRARLSDLGVATVVVRPGGNRPAEGDFLELLERGITALESVLP